MNPQMDTYTGLKLNPFKLEPGHIKVQDIAHHLALLNRFLGATKRPISIAQHSVWVSRVVEVMDGSVEEQMQGLFHDASEAYLGDVVKWVKAQPEFEAYRRIEDKTQRMIYKVFNCPTKLSSLVDRADTLMVRYEALKGAGRNHSMFQRPTHPMPTREEIALVEPWAFWPWRVAEQGFIDRYRELIQWNGEAII